MPMSQSNQMPQNDPMSKNNPMGMNVNINTMSMNMNPTPKMNQPNIKLFFFNFKGRAEAIRLMLTIANVPFEDIRLSQEKFKEMKDSGCFKFGEIPVLEIDGKQYSETYALESFAGKMANLYPWCMRQAMRVDEARCLLGELNRHLYPMMAENDNNKRVEMIKTFMQKDAAHLLGCAEQLVIDNGTGFFVGNTLTIADVCWYATLSRLTCGEVMGMPTNILSNFPNLNKVMLIVENHPSIVQWNSKYQIERRK